MCDEFLQKDDRIKVFHTINCGVSAARNLGLDNACGSWLVFVDSDDTVAPGYLENLYINVEKLSDPHACLIVAGFRNIKSANNREWETRFRPSLIANEDVSGAYLDERLYLYGHPFAKLYSNKKISEVGLRFDRDLSCGEDLIFLLDYLQLAKTILFIDACDYNYRAYSGLSSKYSSFEEAYRFYQLVGSKTRKLLKGQPTDEAYLKWEGEPLTKAISCLYRPPHRPSMSRRMDLLCSVIEADSQVLRLGGRGAVRWLRALLLWRMPRIFDMIAVFIYSLRTGILKS